MHKLATYTLFFMIKIMNFNNMLKGYLCIKSNIISLFILIVTSHICSEWIEDPVYRPILFSVDIHLYQKNLAFFISVSISLSFVLFATILCRL